MIQVTAQTTVNKKNRCYGGGVVVAKTEIR